MRSAKEISPGSILQELHSLLDEYALEGVFLSSPEEGLLFANTALLKMFGYEDLKEVQYLPVDTFWGDEEARIYLLDKLNAEGVLKNQRVLYKRKDGSNFWSLLTCQRSIRNGGVFYEGLVYDISAQVTAENQLKENKIELEKLTMEFDRFIYSASHDIRSPISTIMGIINLMKLELEEEAGKKYIELLEKSVVKLDQFVRELTAHSKNSKNIIADESIDFELLIEDILNEFSKQHPAFSSITSSFTLTNDGIFYSDPDRLRLILYNIIKNSLDYCDTRKSTRLLSIEIQTQPEKSIIEIFDNGMGIPSVHIPRVFDMFYRASSKSKGSGIGLYTVREAVNKLNGIVTLHSEYGIGTTVKIELPNSKKGRLINKKNSLRPAR